MFAMWASFVMISVTLVICFFRGSKDIRIFDWGVLGFALVGIVYSVYEKNPLIALFAVTLADFVGYFPIFRKTYIDPRSESFF